jgi:Fic family protein
MYRLSIMPWTWQRPDWPNFSWNPDLLRRAEEQFLVGGGLFAGTFRHLKTDDKDLLTIETLSSEALTTSEIEGEVLDRASVQSSIRRQLGLGTDQRRVRPAEQGIAEMTVDLYRSFDEPLSADMLFGWHQMLMSGHRDIGTLGGYRTHKEPMQIVSGAVHDPEVHFEAPPSALVPREMARFITWFNRTAPDGPSPLPALTRAGLAHFHFECIHPFEDGNGRIGITIEAQRRTAALIEFLLEKTHLLDRLRGELNERQEKALLRVLREGPEGFKGGLSAGNYVAITGASPPTATRDLADMVAKGALVRSGQRRHARYRADIKLRPVRPATIDTQGRITDS